MSQILGRGHKNKENTLLKVKEKYSTKIFVRRSIL